MSGRHHQSCSNIDTYLPGLLPRNAVVTMVVILCRLTVCTGKSKVLVYKVVSHYFCASFGSFAFPVNSESTKPDICSKAHTNHSYLAACLMLS